MAKSVIRIRKRGKVLEAAPAIPSRARILKFDDERQIVFGWANVCVECTGEPVQDSHDDTIAPEELENAAYNYNLNFGGPGGAMGEYHKGVAKGRLIESMFFTKEKLEKMGLPTNKVDQGWWVGFYIEDEKAWQRVKRGDHRMFSIQGVGRRREVSR